VSGFLLVRPPDAADLPASTDGHGIVVASALVVAGLVLRAWSRQTLADACTRTLEVTNAPAVTDRGPYRHVRHPGYLGSLLIRFGCARASGRALLVGAVPALLVPAYTKRITAGEALLERRLRGGADYRSRATRLIPRVW
jgi:protein-S-isoprenylcysteine O-methyltransferase